jgi:hypothetical protein
MGFEDAPTVRPFHWPRGGESFAGWYFAVTVGEQVGYESWLERDRLTLGRLTGLCPALPL